MIAPCDADYDQASTVFISGIECCPAVIIIADEIKVACATGLELVIHSGGHRFSDGGIVLDLADMRAPTIDIEWRTASRVARGDREKKSLPG